MRSALLVLLACAWLTWPIWLPPAALGGLLAFVVKIHPILAANGTLTFTTPWTEQTIAYHLTTLNQDVPIRLPTNSLGCIGFHVLLAGLLAAAHYLTARRSVEAR